MITIDGSQGEGGGQVLRSALTLSMITGQAMQMFNIRARRAKPGLMAQHLQAVDASAAVSRAEVSGAQLGSRELSFKPGELRSGRYKFEIGTAGAASLVLQTIFVPLSRAGSASSVIISGGTHVKWSPCYHYLELNWLHFLRECGFNAQLQMDMAGFYPQGGGRMNVTIRPASHIRPLILEGRGSPLQILGISAVANLPLSIADRQKRRALKRLADLDLGTRTIKIKTLQLPAVTKGTLLLLLTQFEGGQCCYFSLGELGKPAERVADEAVDQLEAFLRTDATVDQYLADQLLLPLAVADGLSTFHTSEVTQHLLTNAEVLGEFLPARIEIGAALGQPGPVHILPGG